MTVDYLLVCEDAGFSVDGRGFVTGIFDTVTAAAFPVQMSNVMVVAGVRGAPGEAADALLTWRSPQGVALVKVPWRLVVGPRGTLFAATEMDGPRLPAPGDYRLTLSVSGRALATLILPALLEVPSPSTVH